MGELQVGAAVAMRQAGVVLVIGQVAPVSLGIAGGGFFRVDKPEVLGIGSALQPVGKSCRIGWGDRSGDPSLRISAIFAWFSGVLAASSTPFCQRVKRSYSSSICAISFSFAGLIVFSGSTRMDLGFGHFDLLDRTFQFDPVDPDRGRSAVAVLLLVAVELASEEFPVLGWRSWMPNSRGVLAPISTLVSMISGFSMVPVTW